MKAMWIAEFDRGGSYNLWHEFRWLVRHGSFGACWQWPLVFGGGRAWHDQPIWFLHCGLFGVDLVAYR